MGNTEEIMATDEEFFSNKTEVGISRDAEIILRQLVSTLIDINEDCLLFEVRDEQNNRSLFVEITTFIKEDSKDG